MSNIILCTVDLSESSKKAVQWAVMLAQQKKMHLTILYTYRLLNFANGRATELKKKVEEEANKQFAILESELLKNAGISYDFLIEVGFLSDRIEEHVIKDDLNLLVINKSTTLNGKDNLEDIVDGVNVPVLLVP